MGGIERHHVKQNKPGWEDIECILLFVSRREIVVGEKNGRRRDGVWVMGVNKIKV